MEAVGAVPQRSDGEVARKAAVTLARLAVQSWPKWRSDVVELGVLRSLPH